MSLLQIVGWMGEGRVRRLLAVNPRCSFFVSVNLDGSLNLAGTMLLSLYV